MKFEKEKEDHKVARTMTIVDRFGNPIPGAISFDDVTGLVEVYEPEDGPGGHGRMVKRNKYHPEGMAVVDDIARPDEQQIGDIRERKTGKRERGR